MKLSKFNYNLPESFIALRPVRPRSNSKLLVYKDQKISNSTIKNLKRFIRSGDRLVVNDSKVIPATLIGSRVRRKNHSGSSSQVKISLNLDRQVGSRNWLVLAKPMRRLRIGDRIEFSTNLFCKVVSIHERFCEIQFNSSSEKLFAELEKIGSSPLPHYILSRRNADVQDQQDYQTIFGERIGAVAAPTASLHFDQDIIDDLLESGVTISRVTLHVGSGTFLPITSENILQHKMHSEWGEITSKTVEEINETQANNGRIIAVGTTSLRIVETATFNGNLIPWSGLTDLYIQPGFRFRVVDGLVTNFHLPQSTLLVLVSAFIGYDQMKRIYRHALDHQYRFLSYGDSSLLFRQRA